MAPRKIYVVVLIVALAALLVLGIPVLTPYAVSVSGVTVGSNPMSPLTTNPSFESGYSSWQYSVGSGSAMNIVTSSSFTGTHSLYINAGPNDTSTQLIYANNQTLPIDLNQSTVFYMTVKYTGGAPSGQLSRLDVALFISYQDIHPVVLVIALGNLSIPSGTTLTTESGIGIEMYRNMLPGPSWQQYVLQLSTPRMLKLYEQSIYRLYGINATGSQPSDYFLTGLLIRPYNINCYLDDVGIFTEGPAPVQVTISKLTPLPSSQLIRGLYVNSTALNYSYSYGAFSDGYSSAIYLPMVNGLTLQFSVVTITGYESLRTLTIVGAPNAI
ncbi:MAG: hypothetical protein JRN68_05865 [Nitrososphaerota archaeon]|nr:hypothetical protein [Nitrososphaerota archaeon]